MRCTSHDVEFKRMAKARGKTEVLVGRDEDFNHAVLRWSGCAELWEEHELGDDYDFVRNVLDELPELDVERDEWNDNMPGCSGYDYRLEVTEPDVAKRTIRRIRGMGALLRGREGAEGPRRAADGAARVMLPSGGQAA
jgi:hypothetical protein